MRRRGGGRKRGVKITMEAPSKEQVEEKRRERHAEKKAKKAKIEMPQVYDFPSDGMDCVTRAILKASSETQNVNTTSTAAAATTTTTTARETESLGEAKGSTENAALAHLSTGSKVLDYYFSAIVREAPAEKVDTLIADAWLDNPKLCMQVTLHGRDCRHGKGERDVVYHALMWLRRNKPKTYLRNLRRFLDHGCYKDLLQLAVLCVESQQPNLGHNDLIECEVFAEDLLTDHAKFKRYEEKKADKMEVVETDSSNSKNAKKVKYLQLSLAGKWAPNENSSFAYAGNLAKRIANLVFMRNPDCDKDRVMASYRKMIVPLRAHIKVLEQLMCAGRWEEIEFAKVPAKAHNRMKAAFKKHQPERYQEYLTSVSEGKAEIKTAGLQPHELVKHYMSNQAASVEQTVEAQWKTMIDKLKAFGKLKSALSVCDVSGSMSGTPMEVAIALGLVTSELCEGPFHGRVVTFHENPSWHVVSGATLQQKVQGMQGMQWGMNTDLMAVFRMILEVATSQKCTQEHLPATLYIFSDMQFDQAVRGNTHTPFQVMKQQFEAAGYRLPQVVFWNLRGNTAIGSFPVQINADGVAMVSGFSAEILKVFMEEGEFSPMQILLRTVSKYEVEVDESEV